MRHKIKLLAFISNVFVATFSSGASMNEIDYEKMYLLDAENLAEQGILETFNEVKDELAIYNPKIVTPTESMISDSYKIQFENNVFEIYSPSIIDGEGRSWGRATFTFFEIVNAHLVNSNVKFYALYNGNDLGGIFLNLDSYQNTIKKIERKTDLPYLPTNKYPLYGQPN
ncbi:MAG: hypothetical protein HRU38_17530 [Saccharospirillaceae bacterium]|nr:hypothetical protein [Pseudomonadales bacterium]NRB80441.1 hypothetical protein [Saccharospirillaceae bacterium]